MPEIGAGYAAVGKAKRSMIDREKKTNMWENIISDVGSAAIFAGGQIKKAKTAWKEYEAGYKELGGEDFERPKFGQKGFFKGPEGDVRIGNTMYDRSKIQKAGSFLGSDAAAVLDKTAIDRYLQRTVPGREIPSPLRSPVDPKKIGTGETTSTFETPVNPLKNYDFSQSGPAGDIMARTGLQTGTSEPLQESKSSGVDPDPRGRNLGSMWLKFKRHISEGLEEGAKYNTGVPFGEEWDVVPKEKDISAESNGGTAFPNFKFLPPFKPKFARGGDFITNGPQEIIVGDNPGGRERVTVVPLDSEDIKGYYGKKHNWLEALYENNARRKKY